LYRGIDSPVLGIGAFAANMTLNALKRKQPPARARVLISGYFATLIKEARRQPASPQPHNKYNSNLIYCRIVAEWLFRLIAET
jgi:hypothetical protein